MIPKTKLLELIEDYCLNNLDHSELLEFENELLRSPELKKEIEFEQNLQSAVTESDIIKLREKLQDASKHENDAIFGLLDGFEDIQQPSNVLSPEELLNMYDSLPKAHIYQHELVADENIHEFYREQFNSLNTEDGFEELDDMFFEANGLEEAILEKDIINLRENLGRISSSVREKFSTEEIDAFLNNELPGKELKQFEQELAVNNILQREVKIHREIESAVLEPDIISLRNELKRLTQSETSWNVSEEQIEAYINDELAGEGLVQFQKELNENNDLKAEVVLRRNVDKSIGETEIFNLRSKLQQVKHDLENTETRSLVPDSKITHITWWRAGVAIAVILLSFAGILSNGLLNNHLQEEDLMAPQWTPHRAILTNVEVLYQANDFYSNGAYEEAIALYDKAIAEEENKFVYQFYKASTLHNLEKYSEAIPEYSKVVAQGDNMFVEEAEWYRALCYLKLGDNEKAKRQLVGIMNRNSNFARDAKAVLRKNRFSFK